MIVPEPLPPLDLAEIEAAAARIAGTAVRTPLLRLQVESETELWLKLECLQPIGSFKLRGALNAIRALPAGALAKGVHTTSAGNFAQGLAWAAREAGVPCAVYAPDHAPATKLAAIQRLGATVTLVPFAQWWHWLQQHHVDGATGSFVHPGADSRVMAGNATIGLEILAELPDAEAILVPYGSGGLACGIACATHLVRPATLVHPVELTGRAPLRAARAHGSPTTILYTANFIDGMGGTTVLPEIWPLAQQVLAPTLEVTVDQTADALRLLAERMRIIAEGAGAAPVAAALRHATALGVRRIVCVVSGGNIDTSTLTTILAGTTPT
jgi:threonine dehydratase